MKNLLTKIFAALGIVLTFASLCSFPIAHAESIPKEQALAFIENVLPLDLAKYDIAFTKQSTLQLPFDGIRIDTVRYTLSSDESTVNVICDFQDNVLKSCQVSEKIGSAISDKQYANLIDAVKNFLGKYQTYTKIDSTNLITMLDDTNITKDSTITVGNTKLAITKSLSAGGSITHFNWVYRINGADYTSLQLGFLENGVLSTLYDSRAIYTIGDTTVNVSSEQAIDIAMKYLSSYSYEMPGHVFISDFNITKERTTTELVASPINFTVLIPYWSVKLYLNQTYPGTVKGFNIYVWAKSGEIFSCTNIAIGGPDYDDPSASEPTQIPPSPLPSETNADVKPSSIPNIAASSGVNVSQLPSMEIRSSMPDIRFLILIAMAIAGLAVASIAIMKKRKE